MSSRKLPVSGMFGHIHQTNEINFLSAFGGSVFTVVTSNGGEAITLATSGAGVVTSFAGQKWTAATSAVDAAVTNNDDNAALSLTAFGFMPGAVTVLCSAIFGAVWTLI